MSLEQCANERGVVGEDSPIERWRSVVAATGESASSCRDSRDDVCIVRVVYLLGARWSGLDWVSRIIAVLRPPRRRRRDGKRFLRGTARGKNKTGRQGDQNGSHSFGLDTG